MQGGPHTSSSRRHDLHRPLEHKKRARQVERPLLRELHDKHAVIPLPPNHAHSRRQVRPPGQRVASVRRPDAPLPQEPRWGASGYRRAKELARRPQEGRDEQVGTSGEGDNGAARVLHGQGGRVAVHSQAHYSGGCLARTPAVGQASRAQHQLLDVCVARVGEQEGVGEPRPGPLSPQGIAHVLEESQRCKVSTTS